MNILWIINCKYYRYIASYSSINMIYAANKGGQFYSGGGSIVPVYYCPRGAEVFRYIITSRQLCTSIILGGSIMPLHRAVGGVEVWGAPLLAVKQSARGHNGIRASPPPPRTFPPPPRAIPPGYPPSGHNICAYVLE